MLTRAGLRRAAFALAVAGCAGGVGAAFAAPVGAAAPAASPGTGAPQRVVSINLCTDQLAMMLAAPGQLRSVSMLARDPDSSLMAQAARAFPVNHGRAEEIYLLDPDLVLASSFTSPATLSMLRRLGIRVETFDPETSLDGIRDSVLRMGRVLGRDAQAQDVAGRFAADLAALRQASPARPPRAATWEANGYTTGVRTLSGDALRAAGFSLLAEQLGIADGAAIPLESLLMADLDAIVTSRVDGAPARADDVVRHPALATSRARRIKVSGREWACGLPAILDVVRDLSDDRRAIETGAP